MKVLLSFCVVLFLGACAPLTELQKEELIFNKWTWEADYQIYEQQCENQGGVLITHGRRGLDGIPPYKTEYYCADPREFRTRW